jgi:hypothetical protein
MNLQAEKQVVVEQFKQINDIDLIRAIKNLLDYAVKKEKDRFAIPEEHQKLVMDRFNKVRKNPGNLFDWEEAKKILNTDETL